MHKTRATGMKFESDLCEESKCRIYDKLIECGQSDRCFDGTEARLAVNNEQIKWGHAVEVVV